jgi:hypothetical protein
MPEDKMRLRGHVRVWKSESGLLVSEHDYFNTATDWARAVIANLIITPPNSESTPVQMSRPLFISLGNGTGKPQRTDMNMFAEVYGTRKQVTYTSAFQAYVAQMTTNYLTTDPNGTYTEAGLWDSDVSTTTLSANAAAGDKTIYVPSTAPAVNGNTIAGRYTTIYINDGANSEYASIQTSTSQGATSWTLQSGLKHAHASGVSITVFTGNLWGHVAFGGVGERKANGQQLTVQWSDYIDV